MSLRPLRFLTRAAGERRRFGRTVLGPGGIAGQLYRPASGTAESCTVTDISPGGVRLHCQTELDAGETVIVHVEGFGRFQGTASRAGDHELGLYFQVAPPRRERLASQIAAFLRAGLPAAARRGVEP